MSDSATFANRKMDPHPNRPFSLEEENHMMASYLSLCEDKKATADDFMADIKARTGGTRDVTGYYLRLHPIVGRGDLPDSPLMSSICKASSARKREMADEKKRAAAGNLPADGASAPTASRPVAAPKITPIATVIPETPSCPWADVKATGNGVMGAPTVTTKDMAHSRMFNVNMALIQRMVGDGRLPILRRETKVDGTYDEVPVQVVWYIRDEWKSGLTFENCVDLAQPRITYFMESFRKANPAWVPPTDKVKLVDEPEIEVPEEPKPAIHAEPPAPVPVPVKAPPTVPVRTVAAYDVEFLRGTLADIEAKAIPLEEGLSFLKPTRMQEHVIRALARGSMTLTKALEAYAFTPSQT